MLKDNIKSVRKLKGLSQESQRKESKRKLIHWLMILLLLLIIIIFITFYFINSSYLNWDYSKPENAVLGVLINAFEWGFVRLTPFALIGAIIGIVLMDYLKK